MRKLKKYQKNIIIITFILIIIFFLTKTSLARYAYNSVHSFILEAQGFYFDSSVLGVNNALYKIDNWDGVNNYTLVIDVNSKKNELVSTNSDIAYNISAECPNTVICNVSKNSGIIQKVSKMDSYTITIISKGNFSVNDEVIVKTTAQSTSPYQKSISATYTISVKTEKFSYAIEDSPNAKFLKLKLTNSVSYYEVMTAFSTYKIGDRISLENYNKLSDIDKKKCFSAKIRLNFPVDKIALDMTNLTYENNIAGSTVETVYAGYNYISGYSFYLEANSNIEINFYKQNTSFDYTYPIVNPTSLINVEVLVAK
ncbi:MAG: hypothetical protein RSC85_00205 [Bacilli bacterium]